MKKILLIKKIQNDNNNNNNDNNDNDNNRVHKTVQPSSVQNSDS